MKTILLIDDSKFQRTINEQILRGAGYDVLTAGDGEEALLLVWRGQPDLILLDMLLPKLGGLEILEFLKKDRTTAGIPVVVLSCLSQKNAAKLLKAGAAGFLEKGNVLDHPEVLLQKVEEIIEAKRARDAQTCLRGDLSVVWQNRGASREEPAYKIDFLPDDKPGKEPRSINIQGRTNLEQHLQKFAIEAKYLAGWLERLQEEDVLIPYIGMTQGVSHLYGL